MKKMPLIAVGIFILFAAAIGVLTDYVCRDEPPPQDADLRLAVIPLPDKENAYTYFKQALEKMFSPKERENKIADTFEGAEWDEQFVAELVVRNKESFALLDEALKHPNFRVQEDVNASVQRQAFSRWRQIAKIASIRADYLFLQGKQKEALAEAIKIAQVGQLAESSTRGMADYLVGSAIKGIGLATFQKVLKDAAVPPEILKDFMPQIQTVKTNEKNLEQLIKSECLRSCETLEKRGYFFKPNKTKRLLAERYRVLVNAISKNYSQMSLQAYFRTFRHSPGLSFGLEDTPAGRTVSGTTTLNPFRLLAHKCRENFMATGTEILIALKCYKMTTGDLPESLAKLVPDYFAAVPEDPFDGKPIRYSREKKIIYSVGTDLKDSGGNLEESQDLMKEPVLRIDF